MIPVHTRTKLRLHSPRHLSPPCPRHHVHLAPHPELPRKINPRLHRKTRIRKNQPLIMRLQIIQMRPIPMQLRRDIVPRPMRKPLAHSRPAQSLPEPHHPPPTRNRHAPPQTPPAPPQSPHPAHPAPSRTPVCSRSVGSRSTTPSPRNVVPHSIRPPRQLRPDIDQHKIPPPYRPRPLPRRLIVRVRAVRPHAHIRPMLRHHPLALNRLAQKLHHR